MSTTARPVRALSWILTTAWLLGAAAHGQSDPQISLSPDPVGLDERVLFTVMVEDVDLNIHFDATFKVENLRLLRGPSSSTSVQIVNGVPSTTRTLTWTLQPTVVGKAQVVDVKVQIGQEEIAAGSAEATVQEQAPASRTLQQQRPRDAFDRLFDRDPFNRSRRPRRQPREAPEVLLRAEISPASPWVGQQTMYTLYVYTQVDIDGVTPDGLPDFQGFWVHEIPAPSNFSSEPVEYQGKRFYRARLLQRALFPRRAGTLDIEPINARMIATLRDRSGFGSLFGRTTEIERRSNPLRVEVKALPDAPVGFKGAVGRLSLDANLEPNDLAVGDAATLTLTLSGAGHLQGLPEPSLPEIAGIKVFPPQQESRRSLRRGTVVDTRTWRYVLVPERAGSWQLPPIEMPYFDPRAGGFERAVAPELTLQARGATSLQQADGATIDLHPIRTAALPAARASLTQNGLPGWLLVLPWAVVAGLVVLRRSSLGQGHRPARQAMHTALEEATRIDAPRRVAAALEEAWRSYLDARFEVTPGTPSSQWQRALERQGVKAAAAEQLVQLADDLHYLRYAPKLSSTDDLRDELIERSRKLLRSLR